MPAETAPYPIVVPANSKGLFYAGWVLSALPAMFLLSGAFFALTKAPMVVEGTTKYGYSIGFIPVLGALELVCSLLFLIPRTAVLGAILLTAYMGGAVATHVRAGEPIWYGPVIFGVVVWVSLAMRSARVRALLLNS